MTVASALERYMLDLINQERAKYGLNPVQLELNLNQAAEDHSLWMLAEDIFSHTGVDGSSSRDRMIAAGFNFEGSYPNYPRSAENIGFQTLRGAPGFFDDVLDIHNRLMASPDHRPTILNPEYQYVGIGIEIGYYGSAYGIMITQNFASTQGAVDLDTGTVPEPPVDEGPVPIDGTSGADRLVGSVDDELLRGMGGNDRLIALGGDDTMEGGAGADLLFGGGGGDHHDGGAGFDTASYLSAAAGVVADLLNTSANRGQAAGDTYDGMEALLGSRHNDTLSGDAEANRLIGHDGDDELHGRGGRDTLVGGNGDDTLDGGWGDDRFIGGAGADNFVFSPLSGHRVVTDFEDNVDTLDFSEFGFGSSSELFSYADERNGHVYFDFGNSVSIRILDTTIAELENDVILF